ncbi:AAA family ATPase [Mycobacterium intracellulare subsp. chimaera]|uniref:AAA family ATPase n=1 Tax=Mycobacterium intracellulare TaxID=1767 RepID=UPI00259B28F2|nr:AAA family ATPase [Mycobacterium intracellulare]MDM3932426.1 AAA family ATPase [Mycobacterium intracellulare subsp. chimaera]
MDDTTGRIDQLPWEETPYNAPPIDVEGQSDWYRVREASDDGVEWLADDTPENRAQNRKLLDSWLTERQRKWATYTASAPTDRVNAYAQATLQGIIANDLAPLGKGARNDALNSKAYKLGAFVNVGLLDRDIVERALLDACRVNGLLPDDGEGQCRATIGSGLNSAIAQDIRPQIPEGATDSPNSGESIDSTDMPVFAAKLLTRSDLRALPNPEPLIYNVLDQGTTALLYGKWGTAKTFIALDWAACVATGKKWQERYTLQRKVLYVVGEGANGFRGRVDAWEMAWKTPISDKWLKWYPQPVNLTNAADISNLAHLIQWGKYEFIILDTLARCMVGADENSAKDCGIVVDTLTKLVGCTPNGRGVVLAVHHAGKDGKTLRGSSAFESGADTVYFTAREENHITLTREKRKDGPEHDHHLLKLDPIIGTESAVLSVHREGGQTDRGGRLLSTFVHLFSETGATKTELRAAVDLSQGTFYRALSDLLKSGELVNTGTDARPFYKLSS